MWWSDIREAAAANRYPPKPATQRPPPGAPWSHGGCGLPNNRWELKAIHGPEDVVHGMLDRDERGPRPAGYHFNQTLIVRDVSVTPGSQEWVVGYETLVRTHPIDRHILCERTE